MRRAEVLHLLAQNQEELARMGVKSLAVFGSVARDEAGVESDVDLLVELERPMTFFQYLGIKKYLEDLLGRPVDLFPRNGLSRQFRDRILSEAVSATWCERAKN